MWHIWRKRKGGEGKRKRIEGAKMELGRGGRRGKGRGAWGRRSLHEERGGSLGEEGAWVRGEGERKEGRDEKGGREVCLKNSQHVFLLAGT